MITLKVIVVLLHILWFGGFGLTLAFGLLLGLVALDSQCHGLEMSTVLKYLGLMLLCVIALAAGADVVNTYQAELRELFNK